MKAKSTEDTASLAGQKPGGMRTSSRDVPRPAKMWVNLRDST